MFAKHYHISMHLLNVIVSSFNGKGKCTFFDTWMESEKIKVNVKDIENISLNEMRKHQFIQSTSSDLKKITPSSDALNIY